MTRLENDFDTKERGFSLLELLVAITIIAILIAAAMPAIGRTLLRAKNSSLKMNVRVVQSIVQGYSMDHNGSFPTSRLALYQSNSYQQIKNPFSSNQGIGTLGSTLGASPVDNASTQTPLAIWTGEPQPTTSNDMIGMVLYVPYATVTEAQNDSSSMTTAGGDAGDSGFEYYTIEAMTQSELNSGWTSPLPESRITNWPAATS